MNKLLYLNRLGLAAAVLLAAGCGYQPKSLPQLPIPEQLPLSQHVQIPIKALDYQWWQAFNSPELNELMEELESNNLTLAQARLAVERAGFLLHSSTADNYPSINGRLNNSNSRNFDTDSSSQSDGVSLSGAYVFDLWGTRAAQIYGQAQQLELQRAQLRATSLQLQSALAISYFQHLALREQRQLTERNLMAADDLYQIIKLRFEAGSASGVELNQQQNTLLNVRSQLLRIERDIALNERALAELLGRQSQQAPPVTAVFTDLKVPPVQMLQPSQLLQARPDVQLAAAALRAEQANSAITGNRRLPEISISASLSLTDLSENDNWLFTLAESITAPIFNAGKIKAEIAAQGISEQSQLLDYRLTVTQAVRDVWENLTRLDYQQQLTGIREQELANNQRLFSLAAVRFDAGELDFLNVLNAQRSLFSAQENLVIAQLDQLIAVINLRAAMGMNPELD